MEIICLSQTKDTAFERNLFKNTIGYSHSIRAVEEFLKRSVNYKSRSSFSKIEATATPKILDLF